MIRTNNKEIPHYVGHRKRLKERFLQHNPSSFPDYELLELLLFQSHPRKDMKPLAKEILNKFGNLNELIHADKDKVLSLKDTTNNVYLQLKIVKELVNRILSNKIHNKHAIRAWVDVLNYLKFNMGCLKIEQFRVLFLNKKNIMIADEVMSHGTIDRAPVYPREIIKKALYHEAGAIILVHNHPSGDINPSESDIDLTMEIVSSCKTVNITVHDHVVIGGNQYYSFKSNMLL